jgi:hypothetical protein
VPLGLSRCRADLLGQRQNTDAIACPSRDLHKGHQPLLFHLEFTPLPVQDRLTVVPKWWGLCEGIALNL